MIGSDYSKKDQDWDQQVLAWSNTAHYMQSSAWGQSKSGSGWPVFRLEVSVKKGILPVQVFDRSVPAFGRLYYAPEVSGVRAECLPELTHQIRVSYKKALAFKLELYQPYDEKLIAAFRDNGWLVANSVQHRSTVIVNLKVNEAQLFGSLKKRARYEVRVAQRNGVYVEKVEPTSNNFKKLTELMDTTKKRTGAFFRSSEYVSRYHASFAKANQGSLYFAYHDGDLLAGAYVVQFGKNAWYKDGGSVREKSSFMAPRYLQWEIMRDLRARGLYQYDLSGVPSENEIQTSSMKGLHSFKTGFSKSTVNFMPSMELPLGIRYPAWPKSERHLLRLYSGLRNDFWY